MISFENDYLAGAHEKVLQRLIDTNYVQESGYGNDQFTTEAKDKIKEVIKSPNASIYFLVGGTQTNQVVINSVLKPYEGVIAADTGHISTHEAGAIEHSGHKVLTVPSTLGKISSLQVKDYIETFMKMLIMNIWYTLEWFTSHTLPNMAHYIVNKNSLSYPTFVKLTTYHYI